MVKCPHCGELNGTNAKSCFKCKKTFPKNFTLAPQKICPKCNQKYVYHASECSKCYVPLAVYNSGNLEEKTVTSTEEKWPYVLAVLLPLFGTILGFIYIGQKQDNGPKILGISIAAWFFWAVIAFIFML